MADPVDELEDIDEFDDFGLDDSALLQLDQIENKLVINAGAAYQALSPSNPQSPPRIQALSAISKGGNASSVAQLAKVGSSSFHRAGPSAAASTSARPMQRITSTGSNSSNPPASSGAARQMTLFGKPATISQSRTAKVTSSSPGHIAISSQSASTSAAPAGPSDSTKTSSSYRLPWQTKVGTKTWDREAYLHRENAKNREKDEYGAPLDVDALDFDYDTPGTTSPKGKGKVERDWDQDSRYTNVLPAAPADIRKSLPPPLPQKCKIDLEAAKTWIYPTNMEKRDYQYNIVQKALFNNVLAALPTGLGKTFIAAVVILNFFRWYPDGKILFLAPSRPLVDQQKTACHRICGLPWDCAIDLTGSKAGATRGDYWLTKRIFYMTPQTLENDILHKRCDPRDVVCVVVDEAHKARGRYAYGNIIGLLMDVNPHFRVLALSATPGKDADSVQEVVDQLHINQIEIRTEEAIDVQRYMFRKREEIVHVTLGKDLNTVKDNWAKLMQTQMDPLMKAGLLRNQDPVFLHPFAVNAIQKDRSRAAILRTKGYLQANIKELSHMALSMQYLMEQSPTMFYNRLKERSMGYNAKGAKASTNKQQTYANTNTTFAEIIRELELMQDHKGRILHPKMLKLRNVLIEHFDSVKAEQVHNAEAYAESGHDVFGNTPKSGDLANFASSSQADTRVMVFCSYRECCDEIVSFLNDSGFKATEFVGQSKAKSGKKGMSQKDQERVINDFKAGKYNVLVATSIGEEGLDIGSVDLTVCYEAVKDSIRMLQRIGRTGRKREGKIAVLVSEGREQHNWQHSKDNYKAVQKEVDSRMHVELFDDVDRMVPDHISPQPLLKEVEQPEFEPSMVSEGRPTRAPRAAKTAKPKKDPKRNMPEGGNIIEGFRKASTLTKRKRPISSSDEDSDGNGPVVPPSNETHSQRVRRLLTIASDELDAEFEKENLSLELRPPRLRPSAAARRIVSSPPSSPSFSPSPLIRKLNTSSSISSSAQAASGTSDGIETAPLPSASSSPRPLSAGGTSTRGKKLGVGLRSSGCSTTSSGILSLRNGKDAIDSSSSGHVQSEHKSVPNTKSPRSRGIATAVANSDEDDEDEFGADLTFDVSMENALTRLEEEAQSKYRTTEKRSEDDRFSSPLANTTSASKNDAQRLEPMLLSPATPSPRPVERYKPHPLMAQLMEEEAKRTKAQEEESEATRSAPPKRVESPAKSSMGPPDSVPRRVGGARSKRVIIESPDVASNLTASSHPMTEEADPDPASSSPIKAPAKRGGRLQRASSSSSKVTRTGADTSPTAAKSRTRSRAKVRIVDDEDDDDDEKRAHVGEQGELKGKKGKKAAAGRDDGARSVRGGAKKKRKITNSPTSRALFQYEAERSTDEEMHGERDEHDSGLGSSDEDDSDREAVGDFMPTQAPRGYHQQSIYMQSIMSQAAPPDFQRVRHAPFPGVGGKFGDPLTPNRTREVRRAQIPSSEPRGRGVGMGSEDMYSEDSFVVNDEEEIVYDSDSDALPDSSLF